MSDHTTEATDHVPAGVESGNPSMEDILASIRRIIADDDAQTTSEADINPLEANLDTLAAPLPDSEDLDKLLLDTEPDLETESVLNLEDILVLDEDDFSDDTLEIPNIDMLEDTLVDIQTETALPLADTEASGDNGLLDIEHMLESSLDDMDLVITDTSDAPEDTPAISFDMPLDVVELPTESTLEEDLLIEETLTAVELTTSASLDEPIADITAIEATVLGETALDDTAMDASVLGDDIFSALDADLDLVLDDDNNSSGVVPDDTSDIDLSAILSAIDENIQDIGVSNTEFSDTEFSGAEVSNVEISTIDVPEIEAPEPENEENAREQAAIDIEALLDGDDSSSDPLEDLMSTFLTDDDEEERPLDLSLDLAMDNISEPEITNIADDTDIELVKSLMADLTEDNAHSKPTTQDALITPELSHSEPPSPDTNPLVDISPEKSAVDDVLDEIFELAMEDENDLGDVSESNVDTVDASISALLQIAADAEQDANLSSPPPLDPLPALTPEIMGVMPTQDPPEESDFAATEVETETTIEDIDSLFSDSLISAVETPSKPDAEPSIVTPDIIEPQTVTPAAIAEPLSAHEPEPAPMPSLAIEALAAQSFSLDDLMDNEETDALSEAVDAMITPDTSTVDDPHPSPTVDEAILPEPETATVQTAPVETPPLTLPDPQPVAKGQPQSEKTVDIDTKAQKTAPEPEANPTIDIAPTADHTPEKESPEMTKAAASESILDEVTESAASGAFASLTEMVEAKTEFEESGPRIGDLVQEALRPMLKDWLDDNLKGIVERAVQKEVKRISSGN